jgi:hypothetical protein
MARSGVKFGRKMEDAIAALLSQRNVDEAARTAGIGTRTLLRWMKDPEFDGGFPKGAPRGIRADDGPAPTGFFRRGQDSYEVDAGREHAGIHSRASRRNHSQPRGQGDRD